MHPDDEKVEDVLRRLARPLVATWFIGESIDALRHPAPHAEVAATQLHELVDHIPDGVDAPCLDRARAVTADQLTWPVRAHAGLTLAAGLALATQKAPRFAGGLLVLLTAPLAMAACPARSSKAAAMLPAGVRRYLPLHDTAGRTPQERAAATSRWLTLASVTGAALLVAADTAGKPSVRWRVESARRSRAKRAADAS